MPAGVWSSESWVWPDLKNPLKHFGQGVRAWPTPLGVLSFFLVLNGEIQVVLNIEFRSEFLLT